jgi:hypothetical protein
VSSNRAELNTLSISDDIAGIEKRFNAIGLIIEEGGLARLERKESAESDGVDRNEDSVILQDEATPRLTRRRGRDG